MKHLILNDNEGDDNGRNEMRKKLSFVESKGFEKSHGTWSWSKCPSNVNLIPNPYQKHQCDMKFIKLREVFTQNSLGETKNDEKIVTIYIFVLLYAKRYP
uniref:Uncharacterized protein n=1 Tax=Proboscia inermis TaxID=420281 RepID=A0A7S0C922_9STRA|mmetsp:Transcript_34041/g.34264  ORF Transcript_34041/g.34264 Transcript_34041/m.34264 type:complete len:100 (+) Transcript_34041:44-343(+)